MNSRSSWTVRSLGAILLTAFFSGCERNQEVDAFLERQPWDSASLIEIPLPDVPFAEPLPEEGIPDRIVSLIPSATELIFTLGLGDRLVGRSHWCDWPREAKKVPDLGGLQNFSKERIVDLRPDIVILFRGLVDLANSLREDFGIEVFAPETESRNKIQIGMLEIATLLGVPNRGKQLLEQIQSELDQVQSKWKSHPRPRTLVVLDRSSWWVPGPNSFVHELIEIAGGTNVAGELETEQEWPTVTLEQILDWKPEIVLDLSIGTGAARMRRDAARFWSSQPHFSATRNGKVFLLQAGVVVRPGPRMGAVAQRLGEILHGGS